MSKVSREQAEITIIVAYPNENFTLIFGTSKNH